MEFWRIKMATIKLAALQFSLNLIQKYVDKTVLINYWPF